MFVIRALPDLVAHKHENGVPIWVTFWAKKKKKAFVNSNESNHSQ